MDATYPLISLILKLLRDSAVLTGVDVVELQDISKALKLVDKPIYKNDERTKSY